MDSPKPSTPTESTTRAIAAAKPTYVERPVAAHELLISSNTYRKRGKYEEALRCALRAAELCPKDPEAPYLAGLAALEMASAGKLVRKDW